MVVAGDFKNGITFDMDGQVMSVIEFQHVKPGKGAAFVRTKLRNVITGAVIEKTFNPTDKFQDARIDRKEMQYLYNDESLYYLMYMETYEQIPLDKSLLSDAFKFVKEEMMC
ncbi:MAG: elongation factor P, partial [Clostridia bacterium]|nr:elongation factor P [Clostridia bacterium]